MIIPVRCFTCGFVIADKFRYYQAEVRKRKLTKSMNVDKIYYMTKESYDKAPEGEVLDEMSINKMCCRRHFLTHVDIE
jgi:DNA-directed RNA polymerase subunit N (RpoN/RPB10)